MVSTAFEFRTFTSYLMYSFSPSFSLCLGHNALLQLSQHFLNSAWNNIDTSVIHI